MSTQARVGIIANPFSGTDVRRLVSHAGTTSDAARVSMIRRIAVGASEGGATEVLLAPDVKHLTDAAIDGLHGPFEVLEMITTGSRLDTVAAARFLHQRGCDVLVVLGGDGTARDVAIGWLDVPMVPLSTGTNNVFPFLVEATIAGAAAGAVACGRVALADAAVRAKVVHVHIGGHDHLALVDVVLLEGSFAGSRAVWEPEALRELVLTVADPAAVGLSAIAGQLTRCRPEDDHGLSVVCGHGNAVRAPIAPGRYADVLVASVERLALGETVTLHGPGVVAFDGERDVVARAGQAIQVRIERDGPWVIDPVRALRAVTPASAPAPRAARTPSG